MRIPPVGDLTQAQTRPRRPATAAARHQARQVARFIHTRGLADQPLLITLALVSGRFPSIALDAALIGLVFRELLVPQRRGAP
jgi:hypothetical protein